MLRKMVVRPDVGNEHQIVRDVILVHLCADEAQRMQPLGHGCKGEAVGRGSIEERTFPGVIASQEQMLLLLVPYGKAEGAGKMIQASLHANAATRLIPGRCRPELSLLPGEAQLRRKFFAIIET